MTNADVDSIAMEASQNVTETISGTMSATRYKAIVLDHTTNLATYPT